MRSVWRLPGSQWRMQLLLFFVHLLLPFMPAEGAIKEFLQFHKIVFPSFADVLLWKLYSSTCCSTISAHFRLSSFVFTVTVNCTSPRLILEAICLISAIFSGRFSKIEVLHGSEVAVPASGVAQFCGYFIRQRKTTYKACWLCFLARVSWFSKLFE